MNFISSLAQATYLDLSASHTVKIKHHHQQKVYHVGLLLTGNTT